MGGEGGGGGLCAFGQISCLSKTDHMHFGGGGEGGGGDTGSGGGRTGGNGGRTGGNGGRAGGTMGSEGGGGGGLDAFGQPGGVFCWEPM